MHASSTTGLGAARGARGSFRLGSATLPVLPRFCTALTFTGVARAILRERGCLASWRGAAHISASSLFLPTALRSIPPGLEDASLRPAIRHIIQN